MDIPSSSGITEQSPDINSINEKKNVADINSACDNNIENTVLSCEITRTESARISSSAVEEEDAVLGGDDSAREFDVNLDEDELLKDRDTDDCRNTNSEVLHSETSTDMAHAENIEDNSLDTNQNRSIRNAPLDSDRKEESVTVDNLNNENVSCVSEAKSVSSTNDTIVENVENKDSDKVVLESHPQPLDNEREKESEPVIENNLNNENDSCVSAAEKVSSINDMSVEDKDSDKEGLESPPQSLESEKNEESVIDNNLNYEDDGCVSEAKMVSSTNDGSVEDKDSAKVGLESPHEGRNEHVSAISSRLEENESNESKKDKTTKLNEIKSNVEISLLTSSMVTETETCEAVASSSKTRTPDFEAKKDTLGANNSIDDGTVRPNTERNNELISLSSDRVEGKVSEELNEGESSIRDASNVNETKEKTESLLNEKKDANNSKESQEQVKSNTSGDNSDGTKFLHVDQDSSRPEESYETIDIDTGGEDPFAQTCDEVVEVSGNSEKDSVLEKGETLRGSTAIMDVDEMSSDSTNQITGSEVQKPKPSSEEVAQGKVAAESNDDFTLCDSSLKPLTSETLTNCDKSVAGPPIIIEKKIDTNTQSSKNEDYICIVPDKVRKQSQVFNQGELSKVTAISSKSKTVNPNKLKHRARKDSSSEESIDESDFEITTPAIKRPKRNAAKKAESQIRVVRAVEEAVDQEDADINGVEDIPDNSDESEDIQTCYSCKKVNSCKINILSYGQTNYFCDDNCFTVFRDGPIIKPGESTEIVPTSTVIKEIRSADIQPINRAAFTRKCSQCCSVVKDDNEKILSWETMDFCSEECLGKYQQELGSHCANCKGNVQPASLGKYCVRFGYEVKQFCCSTCLEEFKKGLKVCSFCQKDISSGAEGFLAPVGDKGTFKDFCTQACMEKYEQMSSNQPPPPQTHACQVCNNLRVVEVEVFFESKVYKLCSDICFTAYKFANKLTVDRCDMCRKYFDKDANGEKFNIFYEGAPHNFCCKTCMNVYILAKRKIVPCNWCKVKKYNFDMIKRVLISGQELMMCSLNCLTLYQVSVNAVSSRRIKCDMCMSVAQAQYHLTMSDATIRNFCTYPCVMNFQHQYSKCPITLPGSDAPPIPTGAPVPVISSVTSLTNGQPTNISAKLSSGSGKLNLVTRLLEPSMCRNKNTQTRPIMNTKSVSCRPHSVSVHTQTDEVKEKPLLIPVPVPIYVPCPLAMYSFPFPVPIPFPLPVPVPIFLPTTRNSIKGIMKEIKRIQEKVPADPFEAELLMMAEMVAADKKEEVTSSDSEPENEPAADSRPNSDGEGDFNSESMETSNTFGEDIMQIALKMATELDEPAVDLETQLTPATILNQSQSENNEDKANNAETTKRSTTAEGRGRKRSITRSPQKRNISSDTKRKKSNHSSEVTTALLTTPVVEEVKPDANMKLKYTFGVNAWKSWVSHKNVEIEKLSSTNKKLKPLKTDILQLTVDELNFSLSMFVKEVQKPNGTQYAPDTIYYLCLGIQQYLYENGRIDNIFTDSYFESFTDSLDEIANKFTELFNDHHYIVTRVEEEHLWESKQLGAHSPHVLLSTLMFFNTKHFNLTNVEEHMMLSFSHIMKHWKRNINQSSPSGVVGGGKAPGSRNVLLRFYPPQAVLDDPNSKKKKVYEQQENEENPLRCAVKLYEFYMSKCPESVKTRSDVFYLQPERSCVPDSPVWYSTMALSKEPLEKMLNRIKMVKEINIALLTP